MKNCCRFVGLCYPFCSHSVFILVCRCSLLQIQSVVKEHGVISDRLSSLEHPLSSPGLLLSGWSILNEKRQPTHPIQLPLSLMVSKEWLNRDRYLPLSRNPIVAMTKCPAYATLGKATKGELHTYEKPQRERHRWLREREDMPECQT